MIFTPRVEKALKKAAHLHEGQVRKGVDACPVITHPVSVACILSSYTSDEDILAAALLHDTLEDTSYTVEDLTTDFGKRVATIVLGVTIPEALTSTNATWKADRTRYYENLKAAPIESAMVAAADKIHNFGSIINQYSNNTQRFKADFSGLLDDRVYVYGAIVDLIALKMDENSLATRLRKSFRAYTLFLDGIKENKT